MSFPQKLWSIIEAIVRFFLLEVFRLKLSEEQVLAFLQFVKFGIVGVSNTLISFLIYAVSLGLFQKLGWFGRLDYQVANLTAFILSVLWSYFWNSRLVFKKEEGQERSTLKTLLKTYVSYSFTGLFLNTVLGFLWVDLIGLPKLVSPILNLTISVPINFIINKFWAFKTHSTTEQE